MDDDTLAALRVAAAALGDVGFAAMVGAFATPALLRGAHSAWAGDQRARSWRLLRIAGAVSLAATLALMALEAISLTGLAPLAALANAGPVVTATQFGRAWLPGAVALAACVVLCGARRPGRRVLALAGVTLAVIAASHASAGHAGAQGFGMQSIAMTVHLLAIGAWSGAVCVAAVSSWRGGGPLESVERLDRVRHIERLSTLAGGALALVVATGLLAAWHGLDGRIAPLLPGAANAWGKTLDIKLALVAAATALGAWNRFATLPALTAALANGHDAASDRHGRRFLWVLRLEGLILLAVLVAAALLANGEPPAG